MLKSIFVVGNVPTTFFANENQAFLQVLFIQAELQLPVVGVK